MLEDFKFATLRYELECIINYNTGVQSRPCRSSRCTPASAKPSRQRKGIRETFISSSRISTVAKCMAEAASGNKPERLCVARPERLRTPCDPLTVHESQNPSEVQVRPAIPSLIHTSESAGTRRGSASPSLSVSSLDGFDMPPTPRLRTCQLPMSPSIVISPLHPLPPLQSDSAHSEKPTREEPDFDPFNDDPLLRPMGEIWSSLDRNTSLSFTAEPSDEETWPFNNALGLYVDPAMNVATWDAAGFIRSTAPSLSPTRFRRSRQMI